jgi:hypothetical protein
VGFAELRVKTDKKLPGCFEALLLAHTPAACNPSTNQPLNQQSINQSNKLQKANQFLFLILQSKSLARSCAPPQVDACSQSINQ